MKKDQTFKLSSYLLTILFFFSIIIKSQSTFVYKVPNFFYSQFCPLGDLNGGSHSLTCTTTNVQTNIIRASLSFVQIQKPSNDQVKFKTSLSYTGSTTSSFTISLNLLSPFSMFQKYKIGFFLIVIKQQLTTIYMDLIDFNWSTGSVFDSNTATIRTDTQQLHISTLTIFSSIPSGLQVYAFTTFYKMSPPFGMSSGSKSQQFSLSSIQNIDLNYVDVTLSISSQIKMQQFGGFVLLLDNDLFSKVPDPLWSLTSLSSNFQIYSASYSSLNMTTQLPYFGPKFNSKCFIGIKSMQYYRNHKFKYQISNTVLGSIQIYKQSFKTNSPSVIGVFICFGEGKQCPQNATYLDVINQECYTSSTCPLVVQTDWTSTILCPSCVQYICISCNPANRSQCYKCKQNSYSYLSNSQCVCNQGYYPLTLSILNPIGQWNGITQSLNQCKMNCSYFISNCLFDQCLNSTYCTSCDIGFYVKDSTPTLKAWCENCNLMQSNCIQCNIVDRCLKCQDGYLVDSGYCVSCQIQICEGCILCQALNQCLQCAQGYFLINKTCILCSSFINHCHICSIQILFSPTLPICQSCTQNFYLNLTSNICIPCANFLTNCQICQNSENCSLCYSPYLLNRTSNQCTQCIEGYIYLDETCVNIKDPQCLNLITLKNGSSVCIVCNLIWNYKFDQQQNICICYQGFKQNYLYEQTLGKKIQKCLSICGDGLIVTNQQCDDFNNQSYDGCSNECKIEQNFECSISQPSLCLLNIQVAIFSFNFAKKVIGQNKCILSFHISPYYQSLKHIQWIKYLILDFQNQSMVSLLSFGYNFNANGELTVQLEYLQNLQNTTLKAKFKIGTNKTISLSQNLIGINSPLVIQSNYSKIAGQYIGTASTVLLVLLLLQFCIGSYFHKMIGVQTIQIFQLIYFVRILVDSQRFSILSSMNLFQYSANGYSDANLFLNDSANLQTQSLKTGNKLFALINLKKFYILNVNVILIPLFLILTIYLIYLARKYFQRSKYINSKQQFQKDQYTHIRRQCQWIFDHFVFPISTMLNIIACMSTIVSLYTQNPQTSYVIGFTQKLSMSFHIFMIIQVFLIYAYELFKSLQDYLNYLMTEQQHQRIPQSFIQKLQHDQNNPDRANYHPIYILIYLMYYFAIMLSIMIGILIPSFGFGLECITLTALMYFILLIYWKPYHIVVNLHNWMLRFNQGVLVGFLVLCQIIQWKQFDNSSQVFYPIIYVFLVLLVIVLIGGFVRIYVEWRFRKMSLQNSSLLDIQESKRIDKNINEKEKPSELTIHIEDETKIKQHIPIISKRQSLLTNNKYTLNTQMKQLQSTYQNQYDRRESLLKASQNPYDKHETIQSYVLNKIRQDYSIKFLLQHEGQLKKSQQRQRQLQQQQKIQHKEVYGLFFDNNWSDYE